MRGKGRKDNQIRRERKEEKKIEYREIQKKLKSFFFSNNFSSFHAYCWEYAGDRGAVWWLYWVRGLPHTQVKWMCLEKWKSIFHNFLWVDKANSIEWESISYWPQHFFPRPNMRAIFTANFSRSTHRISFREKEGKYNEVEEEKYKNSINLIQPYSSSIVCCYMEFCGSKMLSGYCVALRVLLEFFLLWKNEFSLMKFI